MDNRGIDQDPGWINRQLRELRQAIEALRSERRASATTVDGDLTIKDGGQLLVQDSGAVRVTGTGDIEIMHADGTTVAIRLGDQSLGAYATDGAERLALALAPSEYFPGFDNDLRVQNLDTIFLKSTSGSSVGIGGQIFPGVEVRLGTSENFQLTNLPTTSASANLVHNAAFINEVARSTSSRRYKQDIADHDIDPLAVLKMRVRTWRDRAEVDKDADTTQRYIGFIAEELHDLGLTEFVSYDEQGRPDAVAYDRIPVALLIALRWLTKQVRDERARTDALEAKVATQQQQIDALTARLDALSGPTTTRST